MWSGVVRPSYKEWRARVVCAEKREGEAVQRGKKRSTERSVVPPPSRHRRYLADPTAGNHPPINSFTASGLSWLIQCEQRPNK